MLISTLRLIAAFLLCLVAGCASHHPQRLKPKLAVHAPVPLRDYYSELLPFCSSAEHELTEICREVLLQVVKFDIEAGEYEYQKERILQALHFLMNRPLQLPKEKMVFGLVKAEFFIPRSFLAELSSHPGQTIAQVLFNYVL